MYTTIENVGLWKNSVERDVSAVGVLSWIFLSLTTKTAAVVSSGEQQGNRWQTAFFLVRETQKTLRFFADYVMRTIFLSQRTQPLRDLRLCGIDVIVQRYVDYTGNVTIRKNGTEITWQKKVDQPSLQKK